MPAPARSPARPAAFAAWLCSLALAASASLASCAGLPWLPTPPPTPTPTVTSTVTPTATATITPTVTPTRTLVPTVTLRPSHTSTVTLTPLPTSTPTSTETPAPLRPAILYPRRDVNGKLLDWRYTHISEYSETEKRLPKVLWAYLGFQLMDRAIHRDTLKIMDQDVTVYYLNVQHQFDNQLALLRLVLGGAFGKDVPLNLIPLDGSAYIRVRLLEPGAAFDPYIFHRDAQKGYATHEPQYPDMPLVALERLLPGLSDELIVLADHQILFDPDRLDQVQVDMSRVAYLAARYQPFTVVDAYNRVTGPSPAAADLREFLLHEVPIPGGIPAYSSDTLVLLPQQKAP
jgi:hypothetical protein